MSTERSVELLQDPLSRGHVRCDDREGEPIHVLAKSFMVALEGQEIVPELGVQTMKRGEDDLLFDREMRVERALELKHRRFAVPPLPSQERLRDLADEGIELPVLRRDAGALAREPYPQARLVPVMAAHLYTSDGAWALRIQRAPVRPRSLRSAATAMPLVSRVHLLQDAGAVGRPAPVGAWSGATLPVVAAPELPNTGARRHTACVFRRPRRDDQTMRRISAISLLLFLCSSTARAEDVLVATRRLELHTHPLTLSERVAPLLEQQLSVPQRCQAVSWGACVGAPIRGTPCDGEWRYNRSGVNA